MCWKLITLTPDQKTAVCDHCKAELVYNKRSITNLLRHLRLRHPFEFAAYEEEQLRPGSMPKASGIFYYMYSLFTPKNTWTCR